MNRRSTKFSSYGFDCFIIKPKCSRLSLGSRATLAEEDEDSGNDAEEEADEVEDPRVVRVVVVPAVVALDGADEGGPSDEREDGADTVDNGSDHAVLENAGALAESDAERPDDASNAEEESEDSESDSDAATVLWGGNQRPAEFREFKPKTYSRSCTGRRCRSCRTSSRRDRDRGSSRQWCQAGSHHS